MEGGPWISMRKIESIGTIALVLLACAGFATGATNDKPSRVSQVLQGSGLQTMGSSMYRLVEHFRHFESMFTQNESGKISFLLRSTQILVFCGFLSIAYVLGMRLKGDRVTRETLRRRLHLKNSDTISTTASESINDVAKTDPGLLKKHSTFKSYTTSMFTYPSIRTFYRPHPQAEKLPSKPTPLPLLVFVHGLGGSLAQFHNLLTSLVDVGPCLGIDLPGCGRSTYLPTDWDAYTMESLSLLLETVIEKHLNTDGGQGFVLVAHSLGCSLSILLASETSRIPSNIRQHVLGLVAICPKAEPPSRKEVDNYQKLLWIPDPVFNLFRLWDRRGGIQSASVTRLVGKDGDDDTKKLQERYNGQSRTPVWRRMAWGTLPNYDDEGLPQGGFPGLPVWAGLKIPVFLLAGEADQVTKPKEVQKIADFLDQSQRGSDDNSPTDEALPKDSRLHGDRYSEDDRELIEDKYGGQPGSAEVELSKDTKPGQLSGSNTDIQAENNPLSKEHVLRNDKLEHEVNAEDTKNMLQPTNGDVIPERNQDTPPENHTQRPTLKTTILPFPASHAMLFDHSTYRTIAGLIQSFLAKHIDQRLSLGWQLQHLTTSGKWDVKNLAKWQKAAAVSEPIGGVFRALKTLRDIDEVHSPKRFVQDWKEKIYAVIDISSDRPVYNPEDLQDGGIEYHKFPTVSKIPPTCDEVKDFISLVERIRAKSPVVENGKQAPVIGVHCHYGFNRTGFFVASYLIEKLDFKPEEALDEFAAKRPPGIKHVHFANELFVRYSPGLKRSLTE